MKLRKLLPFSVLLLVFAMAFTACAGTPAIEPSAPADSGDAMADADDSYSNASRAETLIFEVDARGGQFADPELHNPYVPGGLRNQGNHQASTEPLFMLNYQTGEIEPWLGESFVPNDTFDVWTLNIRKGIRWSDGEDFNADDVIFTMNMLLEHTELSYAAAQQDWVDSVRAIASKWVWA